MNLRRVPLRRLLRLEYGRSLPAASRDQSGRVMVAGSNGPDGRHSVALVPGPGIVVGRKGSAGKIVWYDSAFWPIDTTYYVVPSLQINLRWMYYCLRWLRLERLALGAGVPGLNRNDVYRIEVLLPPKAEQNRIRQLLDRLSELADLRRTADAKAGQILTAIFEKLSGSPTTNPRVWPLASLLGIYW